jgi:YD repeat-containing protein
VSLADEQAVIATTFLSGQVEQVTTEPWVYDAAGNRKAHRLNGAVKQSYTYDDNRLAWC